jgi:hypothetical protein
VPLAAAARTPSSCTLAVEFLANLDDAPAHLRESLEVELAEEIVRRGCVRDVRTSRVQDPADAVLRVRVVRFLEELQHDTSLAQARTPDRSPDMAQLVVAHAEARVVLELRTPGAEGRVLRDRELLISSSYRPTNQEDPRAEARAKLREDLTERTAAFACGISAAKIQRELSCGE